MKFEFSAGGIIYKKEADKILILIAQHSQHLGWVFPKGLIGDKDDIKDEKKEDTAVREVKEETGADAIIEAELKPITYWYMWEGTKNKKTVYYFVMKYIGGDITKHDHEMSDVKWVDLQNVDNELAYKGDKQVFNEALPIIKSLANS